MLEIMPRKTFETQNIPQLSKYRMHGHTSKYYWCQK